MRPSVPLGRIAGIPVGLHWTVVIILVLLTQGLAMAVLPVAVPGYPGFAYWLAAFGFAGLFLLTVVAHELAHALAARHYGLRVTAITLWMFGGVSEFPDEPPHPRAALLTALAGPAVTGAAAAVCAGAAVLIDAIGGSALLVLGFGWLAVVELLMAVFNLLPGAPLDGGRALAALLWWRRGDRDQGRENAARAGLWIGGGLVAGSAAALVTGQNLIWLWPGAVGLLLMSTARAEVEGVRLARGCAGLRVEQVMSTPAVCGYAGHPVDGFGSAVAARVPHDAYPVVDLDGRLAGLVRLDRLLTIPAAERASVRLSQVMTPLPAVPQLAPEDPLTTAATAVRNPSGMAVVVRDGRPYGVITASDVRRALIITQLGGVPDRTANSQETR